MAVDRFARHTSKGGQFLLRGMDIRAVVGGEHQDASCQSDRGRQECRLLQPADDIAQPGAEEVDQLQRHRRLAIEHAQEVLPRQEEHVGVLHRYSVGSARLAVEQGDLTEDIAAAKDVHRHLLTEVIHCSDADQAASDGI